MEYRRGQDPPVKFRPKKEPQRSVHPPVGMWHRELLLPGKPDERTFCPFEGHRDLSTLTVPFRRRDHTFYFRVFVDNVGTPWCYQFLSNNLFEFFSDDAVIPSIVTVRSLYVALSNKTVFSCCLCLLNNLTILQILLSFFLNNVVSLTPTFTLRELPIIFRLCNNSPGRLECKLPSLSSCPPVIFQGLSGGYGIHRKPDLKRRGRDDQSTLKYGLPLINFES